MPIRPIAIGIAVLALAIAIWLIVGGIRRHRWLSLLRIPPIVCCLALVALLVPTIFTLGGPHPYFNKLASVSSSDILFFLTESTYSGFDINGDLPSNTSGENSLLVAVQARTGRTLWQHHLTDLSESIVDDGHTVYLVSQSASATSLTAFDGTDGSVCWRHPLPGMLEVGTLLLVGGNLYLDAITNGANNTQQHQLLAIRALDGVTVWDFPFIGRFGTLAASTTTLYVPMAVSDSSILLRALRPDNGKLLWTQTVDASSIVAGPTAVYAYSQYSNGSVTALSSQTGAVLWTFSTNDSFDSAVFSGDTLYVSIQHSSPIGDAHGGLTTTETTETVYALDASTGAVRWKFATQPYYSANLAAGAGDVYIQANDGIHALRTADGAVLWHSDPHKTWRFATNSPVLGSVLYVTAVEALPSDTITLFGPSKGQLYLFAVNTADGSTYWSEPIGPVLTITPHFVTLR